MVVFMSANDDPPAGLTWPQVCWKLAGILSPLVAAIALAIPIYMNYLTTKSHTPLIEKAVKQGQQNLEQSQENANLVKEVHTTVERDVARKYQATPIAPAKAFPAAPNPTPKD
jgi:hypothetical protein